MVANGLLDAQLLAPAEGTTGARLRPGAAASWAAVRRAVFARYGWMPTITSAVDAYRSYEIQKATFLARYTLTVPTGGFKDGRSRTVANGGIKRWNDRYWYLKDYQAVAAVPGTSNHGWGKAVDVRDLGGFTGRRYREFKTVASAMGWSNAEGSQIGEAWHWVFTGNLDTVSNPIGGVGSVPVIPTIPGATPIQPIEEDIMASREELRADLGVVRDALRADLAGAVRTLREPTVLYRLPGGAAAYLDLGSQRRHLSGAQFRALGEPTIVDLAPSDPFWRLPIAGDVPGETYRKQGDATGAVYTLEHGRLRHLTPDQWAAWGRPSFVDLPASHPLWSLLTATPQ